MICRAVETAAEPDQAFAGGSADFDMSGIEGEWDAAEAPLAPIVKQLLGVAGAVYAPFLLANATAIEAGAETFRMTAKGLPCTQSTFKYQAKCLGDLRARYAALDANARAIADPLLEEANCLEMLK